MYYIFLYITCGIVFNLLIDLLVYLIESHGYVSDEDVRWSTGIKIIVTIIWPFAIILLIYRIILEFRKM
jgi:Trk-type K+ transport system membrane component